MVRTPEYKYKFSHLRDYIYCEVAEYQKRPIFYWPVYRDPARLTITCVFFLLAPFVLIGRVIFGMIRQAWYDVIAIANLLLRF